MAPVRTNSSSGIEHPVPASCLDVDGVAAAVSSRTPAGVMATRYSSASRSFGTPMITTENPRSSRLKGQSRTGRRECPRRRGPRPSPCGAPSPPTYVGGGSTIVVKSRGSFRTPSLHRRLSAGPSKTPQPQYRRSRPPHRPMGFGVDRHVYPRLRRINGNRVNESVTNADGIGDAVVTVGRNHKDGPGRTRWIRSPRPGRPRSTSHRGQRATWTCSTRPTGRSSRPSSVTAAVPTRRSPGDRALRGRRPTPSPAPAEQRRHPDRGRDRPAAARVPPSGADRHQRRGRRARRSGQDRPAGRGGLRGHVRRDLSTSSSSSSARTTSGCYTSLERLDPLDPRVSGQPRRSSISNWPSRPTPGGPDEPRPDQ